MFYKIIIVTVLLYASLASAAFFTFDAYSESDYQGTHTQYHNEVGTFIPGYVVKSYHWNAPAGGGCCVIMCNGDSEVDLQCYNHDRDNTSFDKIAIECGQIDKDTLKC